MIIKVTMKKHRAHWDSGTWNTVTIWNFQPCLIGYIELTFLMVSVETMSRMMIWLSLASQTRRYHCGATFLVRRNHQFSYQQRSTEEPEPPDPFSSEAASVLWWQRNIRGCQCKQNNADSALHGLMCKMSGFPHQRQKDKAKQNH